MPVLVLVLVLDIAGLDLGPLFSVSGCLVLILILVSGYLVLVLVSNGLVLTTTLQNVSKHLEAMICPLPCLLK